MSAQDALRVQVAELAVDVGRLRRRLGLAGYDEELMGRIVNRVEILDSMMRPTAAQVLVILGNELDALLYADRARARVENLLRS